MTEVAQELFTFLSKFLMHRSNTDALLRELKTPSHVLNTFLKAELNHPKGAQKLLVRNQKQQVRTCSDSSSLMLVRPSMVAFTVDRILSWVLMVGIRSHT